MQTQAFLNLLTQSSPLSPGWRSCGSPCASLTTPWRSRWELFSPHHQICPIWQPLYCKHFIFLIFFFSSPLSICPFTPHPRRSGKTLLCLPTTSGRSWPSQWGWLLQSYTHWVNTDTQARVVHTHLFSSLSASWQGPAAATHRPVLRGPGHQHVPGRSADLRPQQPAGVQPVCVPPGVSSRRPGWLGWPVRPGVEEARVEEAETLLIIETLTSRGCRKERL